MDKSKMQLTFVNLEPAFNGVEGWLNVSELHTIDPTPKRGENYRFQTTKEVVMADGTIFVYASPQGIGVGNNSAKELV